MISIAADTLAVAIQNGLRFEEIQEFNETLQRKVNDATVKLRGSNRKLHQLDEAKDEFISMASHQLRTPLTSVKGYLSMVLDGDVGKVTPEQRKVLEEAFNSSQRMVYLISDFLNVSRIQTGKFELERTQSNLAEVLSDEIAQLRIMASSRNLKIDYAQPSHFPVAYIDQDKFRQVMMNFIDNAIYYSNPNTTITISLTKEADDIVFKVMDQGIGVPAEERHRLFTKFYRATNAKKQRPDGTGIGLFMAQKVIVAHEGSIIFDSKENQGSTFGFRLPLKNNSK
jgi:signal transduction histidine kinase